MPLHCVVHYNSLKSLSNIRPLDTEKHTTLVNNKLARERLGGDNGHFEQCETIPAVLNVELHGSHEKCYKKFTKGISIEKRKNDAKENGGGKAKRARRSGEGSRPTFPEICMYCKSGEKKRIYIKNQSYRREDIKRCELQSTEDRIIEAAKVHSDVDMQALVVDGKLRERDFRYHPSCHKEYTRILEQRETSRDDGIDEKMSEVIKFVKSSIIECGRTCSMEVLAKMIWPDQNNRMQRTRLKDKLDKLFPGELLFLNVTYHGPQLVIPKSCAENNTMETFMKGNKKAAVKETARFCREEILQLLKEAPSMNWPPKVDDLLDIKRQAPELVITFLKNLLHDTHHSEGYMVDSLIWSYSEDLVYGVSKGKYMTAKHTLLANVLHSLTGQKIPIDLISSFGNCASYNLVQLTETAQAELVQKMRKEGFPLPVVPEHETNSVITHFWWDNFDVKKENKSGGLHTTHGVAFQEEIEGETKRREEGVSVQKSGKRTVTVDQQNLPTRKVVKHFSPTIESSGVEQPSMSSHKEGGEQCILLWKLARRIHSKDEQRVSRFVGWVTRLHQKASNKTVIVYLPPIRNPINEYSTVVECIIQSMQLSKAANMQYSHITADAGAASKFYQVVWNNEKEFKTVLIHLGDLHGFMEFFGMIGKLVEGSGFEDTIYQAELCTTGSIKGIISGKHYNRAWLVNECFAEAIDRLFCEKYVPLTKPFEVKVKMTTETSSDVSAILKSEEMKVYTEVYNNAKKECMEGKYGKTAQFWMGYVLAVERLHVLHYAINTNNFDLRLSIWDEAIQGCFSMNKVNYARLGTYYIMQMKNLDHTHPGAREELDKNGMSVCRNKLNIRQSIDGAGESTFMKDAKIAGGIKNYSTQDSTYEKWVLSRAGQAEYRAELFKLARMSPDYQEPRKCLRSSEISKSEKAVQYLIEVLQDTFLSPFSDDLEKEKLYNLASGCPVSDATAECLLSYEKRGKEMMDEFKTRISGTHMLGKKLFDPITKSQWLGFSSNSVKAKVNVNGKVQDITIQRDILGALVASSQEGNSPVDLDEALSYPLAAVSLPLASADGVKRKTNKSKMYDILDPVCPKITPSQDHSKYLVYDLAAVLRSTVTTPNTFKDLGIKLLNEVPKDYKTIYVACDTYNDNTIKGNERISRGTSEKFVIRSSSVRIPSNFQHFLNNGDNKERLFEVIEEVWSENKHLLGDRVVFFARTDKCTKIDEAGSTNVEELRSNHEEADTKVVYLLKHAIETEAHPDESSFVVRSSSGDIDIPIILLSSDLPDQAKVVLDSGRDKYRRIVNLSECTLPDQQKKALLGIHAFSGCDQIPSFLRKGKKTCWNVLEKNPRLFQAFALLGTQQEASDELIESLEEYVCKLYGEKRCLYVNQARRNIFWRSLKKKKKIIDLSLLPPCRRSLVYHIRRANYLVYIWRQAAIPLMLSDSPQNHGWDETCNLQWSDEVYPEVVVSFLANAGSITCDDEELEDIEEDDVNDIFDVDDGDMDGEEYF